MASQHVYYKISKEVLPQNATLRGWLDDDQSAKNLIHICTRALANGAAHLETLLHVDWLTAFKLSASQPQSLADPSAEPTAYMPVLKSWVLEALFESVRAREFSSLPSRLGSVHAFRDEGAARRFATEYRNHTGYLYACELKDGRAFDTYMEWVNIGFSLAMPMDGEIAKMTEHARSYWKGTKPEAGTFSETLLVGAVVVTGLVEAL